MKIINKIRAKDDHTLIIQFEGMGERKVDFKDYLKPPVFDPLKSIELFKTVTNKKYYILWETYDIDVSADTLWHQSNQ